METPVSKGQKLISIIMATLLGGMMWRCRGESGFGSSWGLYCVGFVLLLIVFVFYGNRRKMKYEMIPFGAFLLGLGVTGYATVIDQTAGVLSSSVEYMGVEENYVPVDYKSGLLIFAIMGFTFVPMFGFYVFSHFSDRKYNFKNYLAIILSFFGFGYVFKATIAHPIVSLIVPDQVAYAKAGLDYAGYTNLTPFKAYMTHFGQRSWCEDIPFFENYYMSVEHVADALAIIVCALIVAFIFRDKLTAICSLALCVITSAGTTLFSVMHAWQLTETFSTDGYGSNLGIFRNIITRCDWGTWEYATGATVGFGLLLILALMPKKYTAQSAYDMTPLAKNKLVNFVVNVVMAVFILALTPSRAIGLRVGKLLNYREFIENYHSVGDPLMIGLTVILGIGFILMFRKNLFVRGIHILGTDPVTFSKVALPVFTTLCMILYAFTNRGPAFEFITAWKNYEGSILSYSFEKINLELTIVTISYVVGMILFILSERNTKKSEK